ncbi:MAG: elongation factor EF-2 [Nanoarchaeota archaeon]|nr:elongation factor EF-2 [Nanoarchaeota archaeon]MBU1322214.1 elongation factor EF-2 [Nanoarchaeota archaeon]MBU1597755.1 elongation factor EF-2 [Nanoarchaeota archaeon]MBU2442019.1 elongation factor EF-2 [Nanoarchaeota archaeon]
MAKMVDKVREIMVIPAQIRNIAIAAHIDHGKTTLSDNLLAGAGMMSEELAGKVCALDFHEDEQTRGITIDTAAVNMVHTVAGKEFLINLLDTPGHVDFGGDVTRAMRAVDGAVVLCCASEGIMPQTETVLRQALKERVKPILFINKTDRLIRELKLTPEKMQERFVKIITHVNKLIMDIAEKDYGPKWQVNVNDGSVCFGSAYHNWALSFDYMKKKNISFKDIIDAYEQDTWKELGKKAPLHEVLLDAVIKHLPNPKVSQKYRIPKIWHGDPESPLGQSLINCDPKGPLMFVVTKVVVDPQAGEISAGRIFSGSLNKGDTIYLYKAKSTLRAQQVYIYNGAKREIVDHVPAGNIIGVGGLKNAYPGETVSTQQDADPFEAITHIFDPVMTKSIEVKNPAELPKLIDVLMQVGKEDPSIVIEINQETGEYLMHGMGELHLEVIENRIIKEKGVAIKTSSPIVVYRETIKRESPDSEEGKSPNKHNKVYIHVEPLEEGVVQALKEKKIREGRIKKKDKDVWESFIEAGYDSKTARDIRCVANGNILIDGTRGIVNINEVMEMIIDMFEDVMKGGPIAREPCIKVKVVVDDLKLHEDAIHRGPAQMYPAVRDAVRAAMLTAQPILYEPVQTLQFEAPVEYMGEISKVISNKRGQLLDMKQESESIEVIGKLPVAEMFGLASELRSATGGRGNFFLIDQNFEKLPEELQEKVKRQIRNRKGISIDAEVAKG